MKKRKLISNIAMTSALVSTLLNSCTNNPQNTEDKIKYNYHEEPIFMQEYNGLSPEELERRTGTLFDYEETSKEQNLEESFKYDKNELAPTPIIQYTEKEKEIMAKLILGEAANCDLEEKIAVAYIPINRLEENPKRYGETLEKVMKQKRQFSCFNPKNIMRHKLANPEKYDPRTYQECLMVAQGVLHGIYNDPTNGATHYFNPQKTNPIKDGRWKENKLKNHGRIKTQKGYSKHVFYKES